jgi:hypothetical protein
MSRVGLPGRLRQRLGPYSPLVRCYRHHRPRWLWALTSPVGRMTLSFVRRHGLTVRHGPFAGMRFPASAVGRSGQLVPKLLGTYEAPLHPVFHDARHYTLFADVGAGDGYYCVGFARLNPAATVVGYETDPVERRVAAALAACNGVQVTWRGTAGPADLDAVPATGALVLVDIEGAERELLNPARSPRLGGATVLVEVHPHVHADVVDVLRERFAPTHRVRLLEDAQPDPGRAEALGASPGDAALMTSEGRWAPGRWMLLTPLDRSTPGDD